MINDENFDAIRCIAQRTHFIKGIRYETCGCIVGAVPKDIPVESIYRCPQCGTWFRVIREESNGILHCAELEHRHYNFSQPIRTVEYVRETKHIS